MNISKRTHVTITLDPEEVVSAIHKYIASESDLDPDEGENLENAGLPYREVVIEFDIEEG